MSLVAAQDWDFFPDMGGDDFDQMFEMDDDFMDFVNSFNWNYFDKD